MNSINKHIIIISSIFFFILSCSSDLSSSIQKPSALLVGDTVAFCAPSGFLDSVRMSLAKTRLEEKGFYIVQEQSLFRRWGYLAGTDEQRANELMNYFRDKSVNFLTLVSSLMSLISLGSLLMHSVKVWGREGSNGIILDILSTKP